MNEIADLIKTGKNSILAEKLGDNPSLVHAKTEQGLTLLQFAAYYRNREAIDIIKRMLHRGFILLPEGEHSNVISFTPPLNITAVQLRQTVRVLHEELWRRT